MYAVNWEWLWCKSKCSCITVPLEIKSKVRESKERARDITMSCAIKMIYGEVIQTLTSLTDKWFDWFKSEVMLD